MASKSFPLTKSLAIYFNIVFRQSQERSRKKKGFWKKKRKMRYVFKVLQLSILVNHELKLFLVSNCLINEIVTVFIFLSRGLKLNFHE